MNGRKNIVAWANYLRTLREFFEGRGFYEVVTDHLVPAGAFEASLDTLKVEWSGGHNELHTSPEIEMKQLLASGSGSIFQICQCFRDDPDTGVHRREFSMLEFYEVGANWEKAMELTKALITELSGRPLSFRLLTFEVAFKKFAGVSLFPIDAERLRRESRVVFNAQDTWDDMVFKILLEQVEPALDPDTPTVLCEYPASMSALAHVNDRGVADRFEIYWKGMELCNGCTELTSLAELKRRTQKQAAQRGLEHKAAHPLPERLMEALEKGLPPCAGVAVGLERLFSCLF
ncbi:MAG: hypothetical protein KDD51_13815 [Bdellovibrionales bacterium]|nr:hypothetical protein [Bdellovibrionales bacterium]